MIRCLPHSPVPLTPGTQRAAVLPQPRGGKCSPGPTRTSKSSSSSTTSSSSVKLCFSYPPFGLMYIYIHTHIPTNIHTNLSIYTVILYYTRNSGAPKYAFLVYFIWLKRCAQRMSSCFGVRNDCALGKPRRNEQ